MRRLALVPLLFLAACSSPDVPPTMQTAADSLALDMIDASGGWAAWAALSPLRFDWAFERDSVQMFVAKHLWDREGDRARVEWPIGEDSTAVVILDLATSTPAAASGEAFVNGAASAPEDSLLAQGYSRFINDSYWLLAPFKTLDPGVNRSLAPDSARGGDRVLALSFGDVGLTPGDRYWLRADSDGMLSEWTYVLEGDTTVTTWQWGGPQTVQTPAGPLTVLTRKSKPDGAAIVTTPRTDVPADAWTSPTPVLQ